MVGWRGEAVSLESTESHGIASFENVILCSLFSKQCDGKVDMLVAGAGT